MSKITKDFQFSYPVKDTFVRDLKIVKETVGYLTVSGKGYFNPDVSPIEVEERYKVDIDFICVDGKDIKKFMDAWGLTDAIEEEAVRRFANQIELIVKAA